MKNSGLLLEEDLGEQSGELRGLVTGPEGKDLLGLGGPGGGKWGCQKGCRSQPRGRGCRVPGTLWARAKVKRSMGWGRAEA